MDRQQGVDLARRARPAARRRRREPEGPQAGAVDVGARARSGDAPRAPAIARERRGRVRLGRQVDLVPQHHDRRSASGSSTRARAPRPGRPGGERTAVPRASRACGRGPTVTTSAPRRRALRTRSSTIACWLAGSPPTMTTRSARVEVAELRPAGCERMRLEAVARHAEALHAARRPGPCAPAPGRGSPPPPSPSGPAGCRRARRVAARAPAASTASSQARLAGAARRRG